MNNGTLFSAKRGLPGCIECKCKHALAERERLNFTASWRKYHEPSWGAELPYLRTRPKDQRRSLWQMPERLEPWIYKYFEYPELRNDDYDYEDKKMEVRVGQYNVSRKSKPFYKAHTQFQVRRNVNWF